MQDTLRKTLVQETLKLPEPFKQQLLQVRDNFAEKLEQNEAVKVYAKLPGWFKVPTPLGTYNPDWAVLVEQGGTERLFFVVETKPSLFAEDLHGKEDAKIECGKAHFQELSAGDKPVEYVVARNFDDFTKHW